MEGRWGLLMEMQARWWGSSESRKAPQSDLAKSGPAAQRRRPTLLLNSHSFAGGPATGTLGIGAVFMVDGFGKLRCALMKGLVQPALLPFFCRKEFPPLPEHL